MMLKLKKPLSAKLLLVTGLIIFSLQNVQAEIPGLYSGSMASKTDTSINKGIMLAPRPPMGWNSWNWFGKKRINEKNVRQVIDAIVDEGLRDAGYRYVIVDGGWRDTALGPNGELLANPEKFPHGIKVLADYAHSKGLKFGLHTVPGTCDCGGDRVGGYGHEEVQVQQFVNWGIDFIKLDKCKMDGGWNEKLLEDTYTKWNKLLKNCGRDIVLSVSAYRFRSWNPEIAQMSRTTGDIAAKVNGGARFSDQAEKKGVTKKSHALSVLHIAAVNNKSAQYAGNGYWNNPDMLVLGDQGLTVDEQKIHFALWCIMSAPLMLGNDPRQMEPEERNIILNKDCIKVDQDPTEQGKLVKTDGDIEVWVKRLRNKQSAVLVFNKNPSATRVYHLEPAEIGITNPSHIKDIYENNTLQLTGGTLRQTFGPHSGIFLLVE